MSLQYNIKHAPRPGPELVPITQDPWRGWFDALASASSTTSHRIRGRDVSDGARRIPLEAAVGGGRIGRPSRTSFGGLVPTYRSIPELGCRGAGRGAL